MKFSLLNNPKKFQRKNLNKFVYLKKKNSKNNIISLKSRLIKSDNLEMISFFLKKKLSIKNLIMANCNKTKTKKPLGSKLGGGKGKIDSFYKVLKKYQPIILNKKSIELKYHLKNLNKIF